MKENIKLSKKNKIMFNSLGKEFRKLMGTTPPQRTAYTALLPKPPGYTGI